MFPEKWGTVHGFLEALVLPNVFPRYFEFLGACLTVTGLFVVGYNKRKNYPVEEIYITFTRFDIYKIGFGVTFIGLGLQILFGLIVVFTIPAKGLGFDVISIMIATGITLIYAFYWTWKTLTGEQAQILQFFTKIVISIVVFLVLYGGNRQLYRHNALAPHQKLMAAKTKEFQKLSEEARLHPVVEVEVADTSEFGKGKDLFTKNCSSCHKEKEKLVGPPMTEMVSIYENNPEGLKKWINSPGKKRPDYPQMPSFGSLSDEDLNELTKYILSIKK